MRFFFKVEFANGKVSQTRSIDSSGCMLVDDVLERILDKKLQLHPRDSLLWEALNSRDKSAIQISCRLEDLDKENGPGSINNPFLILSPEANIKRAKQVLVYQGIAPEVDYDVNGNFLCIPQQLALNLNKGIKGDMILYSRESLKSQFAFLREDVINKGKKGWVLGPPGTGKSVAGFAFSRNLAASGWMVTWISFLDGLPATCVQFDVNQWYSGSICPGMHIDELLEGRTNPYHLVFLDGYRDGHEASFVFLGECEHWARQQLAGERRRLAIVSSMCAHKSRQHSVERHFEKEFYFDSWSLDELQAACDNEHILNAFNDFIDASTSAVKAERIAAKYYYAGGSARFMFEMTTNEVVSLFKQAMHEISNLSDYICKAFGDQSIRNILLGSHRNQEGDRYPFLISEYAAIELGTRAGPDGVKAINAAMQPFHNPAISGWLFEMQFFSTLTSKGLTLSDSNGGILFWDKSQSLIQLQAPPSADRFAGPEFWMKPARWNQPGFDAVHVKPQSRLVEFFQITHGTTNNFKIHYFAEFLSSLSKKSDFNIEIYFVLSRKNICNFKPTSVTGLGCLSNYRNWQRGQEVANIKYLTMEEF